MGINPTNKVIENRLKPVQPLLETAQKTVSLIVGLTSLVIILGFIIVNLSIAQKTDLYSFNISAGQYIAAGILPVIVLLVLYAIGYILIALRRWSIVKRFEKHTASLTAKRNELAFESTELLHDETIGHHDRDANLQYLSIEMQGLTDEIEQIARTYTRNDKNFDIAIMLLIFLFGIYIFGSTLYPTIPRWLGGGKPAEVILVLKSTHTASSIMLSDNGNNEQTTATLLLLAELTNGFLVADQNTGRVVAIDRDIVAAVIDDQISSSLIAPTSISTPVPTETPTP